MLLLLCLSFLASTSAIQDDYLSKIAAISDFESSEIERLAAYDPDAHLNTLQLVDKYGYNGELHKVVTTDGYILEVHRITGRHNSTVRQKPVVFLMHGIMASSSCWVLSGPEKGLAYLLADAGYDVWLGNARGTTYARKHISKSIQEKDYWNFSFHEIAVRDLPAMIDYTLNTTGRENLLYLGHSQGTTTFFVMTSELPQYQNKIKAMFALAPVAYAYRLTSPALRILAPFSSQINVITKLIGTYEFSLSGEFMDKIKELICSNDAITQPICTNVFFLICGFNPAQFNMTLMPTILGHAPDHASTKQLIHFAQLIQSGYFRQYDYGMWNNLKKYNRLKPPSYDLRKIKIPVSLHFSANDWLAHIKDVDQLYHELGNPLGKFRVLDDKFNHVDFLWAKDVKELLYDKVLSLMTHFK